MTKSPETKATNAAMEFHRKGHHTETPKMDTIRILLWTTDLKKFWPPGTEGFKGCKLPEGKICEQVGRHQYNNSDAVIFHGQKIMADDLPAYRFPHQKWIFFEVEAPPQTWIQGSLVPIRNDFNLTSTITFDSDVPILQRHRVCEVDLDLYRKIRAKKIPYAKGKGAHVAWFVSHCETQSKREAYVKELSKYIPVDIVGTCGNLTCGSKKERVECDEQILNKEYKFYLSFENSICEGYVSEKLWRLIREPITVIPIVMGGVDYRTILPDDTYIDIKDFSSPKDLASYLKHLDKNDEDFNHYIIKKNSLKCKFYDDKQIHEVRYSCVVCDYLHRHQGETTHAPDVVKFWSEERRCKPPEQFYKNSFKFMNNL